MLRQLLTLLAVISGFTLAAEPVHAAQGAVVSVASASECADTQPAAHILAERLGIAESDAASSYREPAHRVPPRAAPAVRLQADRARE